MAYNKLIIYGNNLEIYEYEKNLPERLGKVQSIHASRIRVQGMDVGGNNESEREFDEGKRSDNSRRASMAFRRLVSANLTKSGNPVLITLTYSENIGSLERAYSDFRAFGQRCRYNFGQSFRYIAVPEFQKRGAVHFHALYWGLPPDIHIRERETRMVAALWSHGFVFIKPTDGNERLSSYLAKYMAKAFTDKRLKNQKAYTSSRNCLRPQVISGFAPVWPILDDWVGDNLPCIEKVFMTKWLGKGRFRLFNLTPHNV